MERLEVNQADLSHPDNIDALFASLMALSTVVTLDQKALGVLITDDSGKRYGMQSEIPATGSIFDILGILKGISFKKSLSKDCMDLSLSKGDFSVETVFNQLGDAILHVPDTTDIKLFDNLHFKFIFKESQMYDASVNFRPVLYETFKVEKNADILIISSNLGDIPKSVFDLINIYKTI